MVLTVSGVAGRVLVEPRRVLDVPVVSREAAFEVIWKVLSASEMSGGVLTAYTK